MTGELSRPYLKSLRMRLCRQDGESTWILTSGLDHSAEDSDNTPMLLVYDTLRHLVSLRSTTLCKLQEKSGVWTKNSICYDEGHGISAPSYCWSK